MRSSKSETTNCANASLQFTISSPGSVVVITFFLGNLPCKDAQVRCSLHGFWCDMHGFFCLMGFHGMKVVQNARVLVQNARAYGGQTEKHRQPFANVRSLDHRQAMKTCVFGAIFGDFFVCMLSNRQRTYHRSGKISSEYRGFFCRF